jgi:hypothetical protein
MSALSKRRHIAALRRSANRINPFLESVIATAAMRNSHDLARPADVISESLQVYENNNPITRWYGRVSLLTFFATSTSGGSPARRGLCQLHHGRRAKRPFQSDDWRCQHSSWLVFAQERYHWQLQHRCWRWNAGNEHRKRKYGCRHCRPFAQHRQRQHSRGALQRFSTIPLAALSETSKE